MREISEEEETEDDIEDNNQTEESNQEAEREDIVEQEEQTVEDSMVKTETNNKVRAVARPRASNKERKVVRKDGKTFNCQECDATYGSHVGLLHHRRSKHEGRTVFMNVLLFSVVLAVCILIRNLDMQA